MRLAAALSRLPARSAIRMRKSASFGGRACAVAALALASSAALADTPVVVADIAPVATLVTAVLGSEVTPLVEPNADPHHFQLRPSQVRELARADAVFWMGHTISPWLDRVLEANAPKAEAIDLTEAAGVTLRPYMFGAEGGHDDHEAHDHAAESGAEKHADGAHDHKDHPETAADPAGHDHDHGTFDAHLWVDPANAAAMVDDIAQVLGRLDPEGGARYAANAAAAKADIGASAAKARALLAPYKDARLIVFHDAYANWAAGFDMTIVAAIAEGDAAAPGAAAQKALRDMIAASGADCILVEAQHPAQLAQTLASETGIPVGRFDPMTADRPGAWFETMAEAVVGCLSK